MDALMGRGIEYRISNIEYSMSNYDVKGKESWTENDMV